MNRSRQDGGNGGGPWGEGSDWETRCRLTKPPELTADIAARRWRELNLLLHSLVLLPSERGRSPFFPVLRSAATIVGARRALFWVQDETGVVLELSTAIGFPGQLPEGLRRDNRIARAAIQSGKPILVNVSADETLKMELRLLGEPYCLAIPIMKRGGRWGAIQVGRAAPFEEDEAILLWIYALTVEGMFPGLLEFAHAPDERRTAGAETKVAENRRLRAVLKWEIERASWLQRPCSLVRIGWWTRQSAPAGDPTALISNQALRTIRQSLRPMDLVASGGRDDLLICLPDVDSVEARKVMQDIRRNLLQRRTLGEEAAVQHQLSMSSATYPADGDRGEDLIRAVTERGEEPAEAPVPPKGPMAEG